MKVTGAQIKGVIFDVDGTLLDSMAVWENVGNEFLLRRGIDPRENLAETFKTMSLSESASYYQTEYGINESEEEIIAGINELIQEAYEQTIPLKEGVREFLSRLSQEEIPMYIATATDRSLVLAALKRTKILKFFSGIITCQEAGAGKESSKIYEEAQRQLGTQKENTLVVEDAYYAAATAKAAGYQVLGVYDSFEEQQQQMKELSDYYAATLADVKEII